MVESSDDSTKTYKVLTAGTMVSHFRIARKIGSGGMGEIYQAEDTKLKRQVALKFMPDRHLGDAGFRARFIREAESSAKLDHPNIVTVHEVDEYKGRPFFAMQLVEGQTLRKVIKGGHISFEAIVELAFQISDGLEAAHRAGVIHRDIKPSNIIVDTYGRPRILDFGLSAIRGGQHLTKSGSTLGTVGYMSPEQVRGDPIDHRSDLFSLGVTLYELIAGTKPFKRDNDVATMKAICDDVPEPLARFKTNVPGEMENIVSKLLEKEPALRYQSAAGLLADLKRLKKQTHPEQPVRMKRATRIIIWSAAIIIATVSALYYGSQKTESQSSSDFLANRTMMAVLPFRNLGPPEQEYFADGITDEIITKLVNINGLAVISRVSAMSYKGTDKSIRQIGRELGVDYILEGTIRWDKSTETSRVRISPQLVSVTEDVPLWSKSYDHKFDQIFAIQSEIAQKVVDKLRITIGQTERDAIYSSPTSNTRAYDLYLRGRNALLKGERTKESFIEARSFLKLAIKNDSMLAEAYAGLADVYLTSIWLNWERDGSVAEEALLLIEKALAIKPNLAEAYYILSGYYIYYENEYDLGLQYLIRALELRPNAIDIRMSYAFSLRKGGDFDQSTEIIRDLLLIDPLSWRNLLEIAYNFVQTRQYDSAQEYFRQASELNPKAPINYHWLYLIQINLSADIGTARNILIDGGQVIGQDAFTYELTACDILEGKYESALARLPEMIETWWFDSSDYYLTKGHIYRYMGNQDASRAYFDSARVLLEKWLDAYPTKAKYHAYLGIAYAGLSRREDALREGNRALELVPLKTNAIYGPYRMKNMTAIYALLGMWDECLDQIEYLLSIPNYWSMHSFRLNPLYAPIRDNPRFKALVKKQTASP